MMSSDINSFTIRQRLARLSEHLVGLWWRYGPDREMGGFHGFLDRTWRPVEPSSKTSIQQARHLWALSMWKERRPRASLPEGTAIDLAELAHNTFDFIERSFWDPQQSELSYEVTRAGDVVDPQKILYAQSFGIYGLSTYGRVYGVHRATERALELFRAVDARAHDDEHGGYLQTTDPRWLTQGAAKETNTHIHLMEAFSALLDATGDERVRRRVEELVEIVSNRLLQPLGYVHQRFERDWTPMGAPLVSYGHDIETAWLLVDAARALGLAPDAVTKAAVAMGTLTAREGLDPNHGGLFDEGVPGEKVTSPHKIWWAQFEALAGLWWLHRLTGGDEYLGALVRVLDWIEGPARDPEHGGWYFGVAVGGTPNERGDHKGEVWKTTYHALRAVVFVEDWLAEAESGT